MNNRKYWGLGFLVLIIAAGGWYVWESREVTREPVIGGERSAEGCLGPAGYAFDETVGACTRSFELTPDIRRAAQIAVASAGRGYALTVVSFNSYEEIGAYDITLERGEERTRQTVTIRNWQVVTPSEPEAVNCLPEQRKADFCTEDYTPVCATVQIQCIKAPCYPIQETFSNACNACKNPLVSSYLAGACL